VASHSFRLATLLFKNAWLSEQSPQPWSGLNRALQRCYKSIPLLRVQGEPPLIGKQLFRLSTCSTNNEVGKILTARLCRAPQQFFLF
jgi:hypothetical protein